MRINCNLHSHLQNSNNTGDLFVGLRELVAKCAEPIIDSLLLREQAGISREKSTIRVDQITLLTQEIEDSYSAKKAGAVFIDLTAA